jgi:RNA polymerase sigma-70 factor (ECF subfamily)
MPQTDAAVVALARDGDSEDVVQETFLRAYKQLSRFESRANFGTWLHRIAVNCSIDLIRSRPHREAGHDTADLEQLGEGRSAAAVGSSPERLMLSTEVQERVAAAMSALSPMERAAFVLRHFEGHSIDEISRALGLKANAAKHSIFRAVRKMRLALEPFTGAD